MYWIFHGLLILAHAETQASSQDYLKTLEDYAKARNDYHQQLTLTPATDLTTQSIKLWKKIIFPAALRMASEQQKLRAQSLSQHPKDSTKEENEESFSESPIILDGSNIPKEITFPQKHHRSLTPSQ